MMIADSKCSPLLWNSLILKYKQTFRISIRIKMFDTVANENFEERIECSVSKPKDCFTRFWSSLHQPTFYMSLVEVINTFLFFLVQMNSSSECKKNILEQTGNDLKWSRFQVRVQIVRTNQTDISAAPECKNTFFFAGLKVLLNSWCKALPTAKMIQAHRNRGCFIFVSLFTASLCHATHGYIWVIVVAWGALASPSINWQHFKKMTILGALLWKNPLVNSISSLDIEC